MIVSQKDGWMDPRLGDGVRSIRTWLRGEVIDSAALRFLVAWEDGHVEPVDRFTGEVFVEERRSLPPVDLASAEEELEDLEDELDDVVAAIDELEAKRGELESQTVDLRRAIQTGLWVEANQPKAPAGWVSS